MKTLIYMCSIALATIPIICASAAEKANSGLSFHGIANQSQEAGQQHPGQSAQGDREAQEAKDRQEFLYYREASELNTIEAYEGYLHRTGGGVWAQQAQKRLDELMFKRALLANSVKSYENYLARFDRDDIGSRASGNEDELVVKQVNDHIVQARRLLESAFYADALRDNTIEAYTVYLERYPAGELAPEAVYGLGQLLPDESPPQIAIYIAQLYSPNLEVRASAARNLQNLQKLSVPAISSLIKLLADQSRLAGEALLETGADTVFMSNLAAQALAAIGDASVPALLEGLRNHNPVVRSRAAEALGLIGTSRAVDPLIEALHDNDAEMRRSSALALGRISNERAVEPLIKVLGDEDTGVTVNALHALASIKDPRSIAPMIDILKTSNIWAAENAVLGLMEFDANQVRQSLNQIGTADQERILQSLIRINLIAMHRKDHRWQQWWDRMNIYAMQNDAD